MTGGSFEAPHAPGSFHGDYAYGTYASNFTGAHGFPEYNYPADTSWPAVEQGASQQFRLKPSGWDRTRESNQLFFTCCAHCWNRPVLALGFGSGSESCLLHHICTVNVEL